MISESQEEVVTGDGEEGVRWGVVGLFLITVDRDGTVSGSEVPVVFVPHTTGTDK